MTLLEALRALDPTDDAHWTAEGLPKLAVLEKLTGQKISRQDVAAIAPDLTRNLNALPPESPEPPEPQEAVAPAPGDDPVAVLEQQIATLDTQVNAHLRERTALTEKIDALSAERDQLQRRLDAIKPRKDENQKAIRAFLDSQKKQLVARGERLAALEEQQRTDPRAPIDQAYATRRRPQPIPAPRS